MISGIPQDLRSRTHILAYSDRVLAHNFECGSCCDSHFRWIYHICNIQPGDVETHSKTSITGTQLNEHTYINSYDKGSWNQIRHIHSYSRESRNRTMHILSYRVGSWSHTRHTILSYGIGSWSHARHILLFYRILKSYQAIGFAMMQDTEIWPVK